MQKSKRPALATPTDAGNLECPGGQREDNPAAIANQEGIIIADIAKNTRELLRVQVREYQRHRFVDLRVHFRDGEAVKPTPKGCTCRLDQIDTLIDALRRAKAVLEGGR
jgi:hypothetical protein